jgi:branched-chain amino acid transport system permease protein
MLMVMAAVSGCGLDHAEVRLCERVARALEDNASLEVTTAARHPRVDHAVILDYRVTDAGESRSHWISCRFAGGSPATGPRRLIGVTTDREGALSPVRMAMLQIWLRLSDGGGPGLSGEQYPPLGPPVESSAYFVQQLVNAIPLSAAYALIAIGFSLVWGVIARFSFSGGTLATLAGCTLILGLSLLLVITDGPAVVAIAAVLLAVAAAHGVFRWLVRRGIFGTPRRFRSGSWGVGMATQTAVIATLGLATVLGEAMRLAERSREQWVEPVVTASRALFRSEDFAATITPAQVIIFTIAATVVGCLSLIMSESRFGRRYRACRDDAGMTALAGVNVDRVVSAAFLLGAASIGVAGAMIILYYGTVSASMGILIGLKALTAAVIGGLGSIGGAVAGGVLIALLETLGAAYLSAQYRDLAIFGPIAVFAMLRFRRLLGR